MELVKPPKHQWYCFCGRHKCYTRQYEWLVQFCLIVSFHSANIVHHQLSRYLKQMPTASHLLCTNRRLVTLDFDGLLFLWQRIIWFWWIYLLRILHLWRYWGNRPHAKLSTTDQKLWNLFRGTIKQNSSFFNPNATWYTLHWKLSLSKAKLNLIWRERMIATCSLEQEGRQVNYESEM